MARTVAVSKSAKTAVSKASAAAKKQTASKKGASKSKDVKKVAPVADTSAVQKKAAASKSKDAKKAVPVKKNTGKTTAAKKKTVKTAALGTTLATERQKLKVKSTSAGKSKKGSSTAAGAIYAEPPPHSIFFYTWRNACDQALFYCPRRFLDKHEVKTFITRYFKNLPEDKDEGKTFLKEVGKALKARVEQGYYNTIAAKGEGMKLIPKYKLEPKIRNKVKTGITFVPNGSNPSKAAGYQPPAYKKRASQKKKATTDATPAADADAAAAAPAVAMETQA